MCGIFFFLRRETTNNQYSDLTKIRNRGPDSYCCHKLAVSEYILEFHSSVLHLRGTCVTIQPILSSTGNILMWNGEVFDGLDVSESENDTKVLLNSLDSCIDESSILKTFESIKGPYAFVFYSEKLKKLWYARDILGRRSLLWKRQEGDLILSSVSLDYDGWSEVSSKSIYSISFTDNICIQTEIMREKKFEISRTLSHTLTVNDCLAKLKEVLNRSVHRRLTAFKNSQGSMDHSIGILFSGGLDSMLLALLVDSNLDQDEPIELLNVAFENPRYLKGKQGEDSFLVPDRLSARKGFLELTNLCKRKFKLIEINVTSKEMELWTEHVKSLIYPSSSVMDFSIGVALWFAARGRGIDYLTNQNCFSNSKVLFVGIGADEQYAGYSRHRVKYEVEGMEGLMNEVQLDIDRISLRNSGRDDRCISDCGKEARFPFLDEEFVEFSCQLPMDMKCNLDLPRGVGEKSLLRMLCSSFGIEHASKLPKRAIQFGAKTAKMTSCKEKGDVKIDFE